MNETNISLFELVMCLSDVMDLVSEDIVNHQKRVSYISHSIAAQYGLSNEERADIVFAGALHDCGAMSVRNRLYAMRFETENAHIHAGVGYLLLDSFQPFSDVSRIVRYHHNYWDGKSSEISGNDIPIGAQILHLADRIEVLIDKNSEVLSQRDRIVEKVRAESGKMFNPELVDAFVETSRRESFWFDVLSRNLKNILRANIETVSVMLDRSLLIKFSKLISQMIDFRSRFTATHSNGVAADAESLAGFMGLDDHECWQMRIAGYFHDLGKLAVPVEILNKPASLTEHEFNIIKSHTYHTFMVLSQVPHFEEVARIAAYHHERLDGKGYPFALRAEEQPMHARVMAVADVFTALTEDRPYRKGVDCEKAIKILLGMKENGTMDADVVDALYDNSEFINSIRHEAQEESVNYFNDFEKHLETLFGVSVAEL